MYRTLCKYVRGPKSRLLRQRYDVEEGVGKPQILVG